MEEKKIIKDGDEIIRVEGLEKSFGKLHVLKGIDQVIKKGDGTICAEADVTWACVTTEGKPSRIPVEFLVEGLHPETDMVAAV